MSAEAKRSQNQEEYTPLWAQGSQGHKLVLLRHCSCAKQR
jgi:hypothetical protein